MSFYMNKKKKDPPAQSNKKKYANNQQSNTPLKLPKPFFALPDSAQSSPGLKRRRRTSHSKSTRRLRSHLDARRLTGCANGIAQLSPADATNCTVAKSGRRNAESKELLEKSPQPASVTLSQWRKKQVRVVAHSMKRSKSQPQGNLLVKIPKTSKDVLKKVKLADSNRRKVAKDYDSNKSVDNDAALEIKGVTIMNATKFIHRKYSALRQSLEKHKGPAVSASKLIHGRDVVSKAKTSFPIVRVESKKRAKHKCSMSIDLATTSRNKAIPQPLNKTAPKKSSNAHRRNCYLSSTVKLRNNNMMLAHTRFNATYKVPTTPCKTSKTNRNLHSNKQKYLHPHAEPQGEMCNTPVTSTTVHQMLSGQSVELVPKLTVDGVLKKKMAVSPLSWAVFSPKLF